jgi:ribosome-associated heat shock protein Hsp15
VRLDKWLQVARLQKTRTQATRACDLGRVAVNGLPAKPHRPLKIGETVTFSQGDWQRVVVVKRLHDKPLPKEEAATLFDDQSPPRPAPDPLARLMRRPPILREAGAGRPTKRDRRKLEAALDADLDGLGDLVSSADRGHRSER